MKSTGHCVEQVTVYGAAVVVTILLSGANVGLKVLSGTLGQVIAGLRRLDLSPAIAALPQIAAVGAAYAIGAALWLWVLNHMPLNRAFLFVSLTFVFVPLMSHLFLGERIGMGVIVGTPIIITGLIVATLLR